MRAATKQLHSVIFLRQSLHKPLVGMYILCSVVALPLTFFTIYASSFKEFSQVPINFMVSISVQAHEFHKFFLNGSFIVQNFITLMIIFIIKIIIYCMKLLPCHWILLNRSNLNHLM